MLAKLPHLPSCCKASTTSQLHQQLCQHLWIMHTTSHSCVSLVPAATSSVADFLVCHPGEVVVLRLVPDYVHLAAFKAEDGDQVRLRLLSTFVTVAFNSRFKTGTPQQRAMFCIPVHSTPACIYTMPCMPHLMLVHTHTHILALVYAFTTAAHSLARPQQHAASQPARQPARKADPLGTQKSCACTYTKASYILSPHIHDESVFVSSSSVAPS